MRKTHKLGLPPGRSETRSASKSEAVDHALSELAQILVDIALSGTVSHQEVDGVSLTPSCEGVEQNDQQC